MLIILIIIKMTSQLFTAPSLPDWEPLTRSRRSGFTQRREAGGRRHVFWLLLWLLFLHWEEKVLFAEDAVKLRRKRVLLKWTL